MTNMIVYSSIGILHALKTQFLLSTCHILACNLHLWNTNIKQKIVLQIKCCFETVEKIFFILCYQNSGKSDCNDFLITFLC